MDERFQSTDPPPRPSPMIKAEGGLGTKADTRSSAGVNPGPMAGAPGLRVRPALESDVAAIEALEQSSFSDPWSASSFRSSLERPEVHMTVAEWRDEGTEPILVGYMVAWFMGPEGEIANIAVEASWQRRGVGAVLLDEVLATGQAAGVDTIYLEVRPSNAAAQALYAGRGFRTVGRRRNYYLDPPEDALVLRWDADHSLVRARA